MAISLPEYVAIRAPVEKKWVSVAGSEKGIPGAPALEVTHVNLNDGTVEGLKHRELPIFAVQYHPEAAPGPHDARGLFPRFMERVAERRRPR